MRVARTLVVVLVLGLGACGQEEARGGASSPLEFAHANAASGMVKTVPEISVTPDPGSRSARPDRDVVVRAYRSRLTRVTVAPDDGRELEGRLAADGSLWRSRQLLRTAETYTVSAWAIDTTGKEIFSTSSFRTLTPRATISASVTPLTGSTVGVGMPVIVSFGVPVRDSARSSVLKALKVTSTPKVKGAWRWMSSQQVQWRPRSYWPSGTKVTVTRDLRGLELSPGYWGGVSHTVRFRIGAAMVSTVDVDAHTLTVRRNGSVVRTIPITTGKRGFETGKGVKVIMTRERTRRMRAETTGIDKDDPEYYDLVVDYAMRLTHSGEFLHAAPWSVGSQGHANVSHGCTGMSTANARWLYDNSSIGDVVIYKGSPRPLEWGNGYTAWQKSFAEWARGS